MIRRIAIACVVMLACLASSARSQTVVSISSLQWDQLLAYIDLGNDQLFFMAPKVASMEQKLPFIQRDINNLFGWMLGLQTDPMGFQWDAPGNFPRTWWSFSQAWSAQDTWLRSGVFEFNGEGFANILYGQRALVAAIFEDVNTVVAPTVGLMNNNLNSIVSINADFRDKFEDFRSGWEDQNSMLIGALGTPTGSPIVIGSHQGLALTGTATYLGSLDDDMPKNWHGMKPMEVTALDIQEPPVWQFQIPMTGLGTWAGLSLSNVWYLADFSRIDWIVQACRTCLMAFATMSGMAMVWEELRRYA